MVPNLHLRQLNIHIAEDFKSFLSEKSCTYITH